MSASAAMFRTRRELEARHYATRAARRRAAPHRDPSWFEVIVGVSAFAMLSTGLLYLLAWAGR